MPPHLSVNSNTPWAPGHRFRLWSTNHLFTLLIICYDMKNFKFRVKLSSSEPSNHHVKHSEFPDNDLLPYLFGEHNHYLKRIENVTDVDIIVRGNQVVIQGQKPRVSMALKALEKLYCRLEDGLIVSEAEVDAALRLELSPKTQSLCQKPDDAFKIKTVQRVITPRSHGQKIYIDALKKHRMTFGSGPAGTGKTYLAVAIGVSMLLSGRVEKIILSRPAVEAGERLGFLPGDLREKIDPYLRPLYDALYAMLPPEQVIKRLSAGEIEIAPLAFMRGRTLSNAYVIVDEAQNTSVAQMKMLLTRLGENSHMVVNGDLTQIDLPKGEISGLKHAIHVLRDIKDIAFVAFGTEDIARDPLVSKIVNAYEQHTPK